MTKTYISILRGINVSGKNKIKMDDLRKSYEIMGCKNVSTYIQSGNVVFVGNAIKCEEWASKISKRIKKDFGFDVPIQVLEKEQIQQIIQENPFLKDEGKNAAFFHVTFLDSKPENIDYKTLASKTQTGEELVILDSVVYVYCPNGYGKTKLNNTYLEKQLKVSATTRNWKTTNALLDIALKLSVS